jgi:thioredoxin-like negative regulator of GroEL
MKLLETQAEFESLWFSAESCRWIVYFTAAWCKPCAKLDLSLIQAAADAKGIPIYKCDETVNEYTVGYCGIRKFPTFVYFRPKTTVGSCQSSNTDDVVTWIQSLE